MRFALVGRGGEYLRIADPAWKDPLDPSYARAGGGRWNPPGSFGVLYLIADVATARSNVRRRFAGLPHGPSDVLPRRRPVLVGAVVPPGDYVDLVTDDGCVRAGVPASYPLDQTGGEIPHAQCQPIGAAAKSRGLPGIASRSVARPSGEELAWFTEHGGEPTNLHAFDDWYWVAPDHAG